MIGNSCPNNREFEVPEVTTSSVYNGIMTWTTNTHQQATAAAAAMDFNGTWNVYSEENLDELLKAVGKNTFFYFKELIYFYILVY